MFASPVVVIRAGRKASVASFDCCCRRRPVMPLRAKILPFQPESRANMSSLPEIWRPQPGDEAEDVIFDNKYGLRTIELNRPKKYNSLNASMIRKIAPRLQELEKSDMADVIVMKGAGKAFCAGGDVAAVAEKTKSGPNGVKEAEAYFDLEYKLDHLIATLTKPYIAFMDGITMGGGVGLSVHAPFRIATERTVYAMPETKIGFFPDVGASFFLPRMPGAVGMYLALTSEQLKGANVFYSGIATHYLHSTTLPMLESRLAELRFLDTADHATRLQKVNETIEEHCTGLPHNEPILLGGELRNAIDRCFSQSSVNGITEALQAETGSTKEWAQKSLEAIRQRSPTSIHVTFRQMQIGKKWSIAETFKREYQMAANFMRHSDFAEGVSALLIRKDNKPAWNPASLADVKDSDADAFFRDTKSDSKSFELLNDRDYKGAYPFANFGLPTETEVFEVVQAGYQDPRHIVNKFVADRNFKQGVREAVQEILQRKTRVSESGTVEWARS